MKPLSVVLVALGIKDGVIAQALESSADAVVLDLEDTVPISAKREARSLVAKAIDGAAAAAGPSILVRTNAAATGLLSDDLAAVVRPGLEAVMFPKVQSVEEVQVLADGLDQHEAAAGMRPRSVAIVLLIESALGIYRCYDLIKSSPRVAGTCIGSARDADLQTDLGCRWSLEGTELLYARSKMLLDTRAAGRDVYPLDGVFADLDDEAGLFEDSRLSARLGYVGRTVIHPKQIDPVRRAYAASEADVAYYKKVVLEFEALEKTGTAAITVDGRLVDYAMYHRAKRVLDLAKLNR